MATSGRLSKREDLGRLQMVSGRQQEQMVKGPGFARMSRLQLAEHSYAMSITFSVSHLILGEGMICCEIRIYLLSSFKVRCKPLQGSGASCPNPLPCHPINPERSWTSNRMSYFNTWLVPEHVSLIVTTFLLILAGYPST